MGILEDFFVGSGVGSKDLGFTSFGQGGLLGSTSGKTALGLGATGIKGFLDYNANKKDRKAEQGRFDKMFDFNKSQIDRTNRLDDERQSTIDSVYQTPVMFN